MSFFRDSPTISLRAALRRYWYLFALLALEPLAAALVEAGLPGVPFARGITAAPAFLAALYPATIGTAPASYWFSACSAWFLCTIAVLAFFPGGLAA